MRLGTGVSPRVAGSKVHVLHRSHRLRVEVDARRVLDDDIGDLSLRRHRDAKHDGRVKAAVFAAGWIGGAGASKR